MTVNQRQKTSSGALPRLNKIRSLCLLFFVANVSLAAFEVVEAQPERTINAAGTVPLIALDTSKDGGGGHRIPRPVATDDSSSVSANSSQPAGKAQAAGSGAASASAEEDESASISSVDDLRNKLEGIQREAATMPRAAPQRPGSGQSKESIENASHDQGDAQGATASSSNSSGAGKNRLLQGSIDQYGEAKQQAFNIGLGLVVKKDADPGLASHIVTILPTSPAERGGVHAGDRLVKETLDKDVVHLSLLRAGRPLEISIKTGGPAMFDLTASGSAPLSAGAGRTALQAGVGTTALRGGATSVKLKSNVVEQMRDHDVVLILDMSGSMQTRDCQGLSRWDWVGGQSNELALAAQQASSDLTVMLFSSNYQVMEHVNPSLIPMIFQRVRPNGGTILGAPLNDALNRYFSARQANPRVKPLIITIITDGLPGDLMSVRQCITNAANATLKDGEISITFLLINGQLSGNRQMEDLDSQLNAQRDIVNLVEFDQVLQLGVKQALFEALSGRQLKNVPLSAPSAMMGLNNFLNGQGGMFNFRPGRGGNFPRGGNQQPYYPGQPFNQNNNSNYGQNGVRSYP